MKKEKNTNKPYLTKGTLILRTVVALYLLYTVYQLSPSIKTAIGKDLIFVIIAMVVFTIIAVPLGALSIKALVKGEFIDVARTLEEEEENNSNTEQNDSDYEQQEEDVASLEDAPDNSNGDDTAE